MVALSVNGKIHEVNVDPDTDLLWVLRDHVGLTGTKYGCGIKRCGACRVSQHLVSGIERTASRGIWSSLERIRPRRRPERCNRISLCTRSV
jgi:xanthine dehydrogenase iron-sulfur cluster and FAD-binding subunit A